MNIMDKTPAKITLHIDGMTWEQVREMIEERYGALMWDHKSTAYPTDSVVVRMAFAEPAGNVAQRAIGKAAPQQEAQEPVAWYVTGCGRLLDEYEAEAEARRIGGTAKAMPLYTVPQPSPASQGAAPSARQALEALDELEASARGDEPFNHFAAPLIRQYIESAIAARAPADSVTAPAGGNWIDANDVNRLVRELDVALNGEAGAAAQASLCDVVAQVRHEAAKRGQPLFPTPPAQAADSVLEDAAPPNRTGIYTWQSGTSVALVLVDKRPSAHAPGGQFNGHVIESTKFYDGCPVTSWGRDGKWTLLHDFDAARKQGANHD